MLSMALVRQWELCSLLLGDRFDAEDVVNDFFSFFWVILLLSREVLVNFKALIMSECTTLHHNLNAILM